MEKLSLDPIAYLNFNFFFYMFIKMPKMKERQFYCVACRKKVMAKADDICVKVFKNKRMVGGKVPALRSYCAKCDVNLTKFIKHDKLGSMQSKYGKC